MASGSNSDSNASSQDTGVVVASPHPITPVLSPPAQQPTSQIFSSNPSSPFPLMVIAQHDFPGDGEDEISFRRGEIVVVIAKDDGFGDGWWTGRNTQNQIGLFPAIYTIPYSPPTPSVYDTQPTSPEADANLPKSSSAGPERVYEGLGMPCEQAHAIDHPLNASINEVDQAVRELSIGSSHSSSSSNQNTPPDVTAEEDDQANAILAQVREWSPQDVAAFLVSRGFKNQASNFIRHEITGEILLELDLAMLKEVDIAVFGVRFNIMREIEGLRRLCKAQKRASQRRDSKGNARSPLRSSARGSTSGEEDTLPLSVKKTSMRSSPIARYSPGPRPGHYRRSSYEPSTPRSTGTSPRPFSVAHELPRGSPVGIFDPQQYEKLVHRATHSQDGGVNLDQRPDGIERHLRSHSSSIVDTQLSLTNGRVRIDSQDSGLGHSRHTSADTMINTPPLNKVGHRRQSSSLTTVRAQNKSIPLMEAVGRPTIDSQKDLTASPPYSNSTVVLPGTRVETPPTKTAKFLFMPGGTRLAAADKETESSAENGIRLVKSYGHLRKRSSSTTSPPPVGEDGIDGELHQHRASLLKNVPAKEASVGADYAGWLKKRTERGTSIAGLNVVGPSVGVVGGWKRRWFILKGRRLSYYRSEKDLQEKGVIDVTAHRCITENRGSNANSPTDHTTSGPTRKISLSSTKFIFKIVPPAPGTSRAVNFTPQKIHIFSAENEVDFRGWVEAFMKANIGLDTNAPVISSSTVPLISLARAKEMKSRPPALDLSDAHRPHTIVGTLQTVTAIAADSANDEDLKSPPLPTPPLAKEKNDVQGNFEAEMKKALGKVGKAESKSAESEIQQPSPELSIPIGL